MLLKFACILRLLVTEMDQNRPVDRYPVRSARSVSAARRGTVCTAENAVRGRWGANGQRRLPSLKTHFFFHCAFFAVVPSFSFQTCSIVCSCCYCESRINYIKHRKITFLNSQRNFSIVFEYDFLRGQRNTRRKRGNVAYFVFVQQTFVWVSFY